MGNRLERITTCIKSVYLKITATTKRLLFEPKQKNYFNNDILLKDDEQKAGIFIIF